MRIGFKSKKLEKLYTQEKGARKYPPPVVDAFFELVSTIQAADSLLDLYALESLHFEQLGGDRKGDRSFILHDRWRLEVVLEKDRQGYMVTILKISKHYE